MDVREIAENAAGKAMDENHIGWDDWYPKVIVSAILAALKEAGYAVVRVGPKAWDDVLKRAEALDELGEMDEQLLD